MYEGFVKIIRVGVSDTVRAKALHLAHVATPMLSPRCHMVLARPVDAARPILKYTVTLRMGQDLLATDERHGLMFTDLLQADIIQPERLIDGSPHFVERLRLAVVPVSRDLQPFNPAAPTRSERTTAVMEV
jgi:hypothetical protein